MTLLLDCENHCIKLFRPAKKPTDNESTINACKKSKMHVIQLFLARSI